MKAQACGPKDSTDKEYIINRYDDILSSFNNQADFEHISTGYLIMARDKNKHDRILDDILLSYSNINSVTQDSKMLSNEAFDVIYRGERDGLNEATRFIQNISRMDFEVENVLVKVEKFYSEKEETVWTCAACGYIHRANRAPSHCPVCRVSDHGFKRSYLPN